MTGARRGVIRGIVSALVATGGGVGGVGGGGASLAAQQKPAPVQPAQLQVSLVEAVRRALDVQPDIIRARGEVRRASANERAAWGAYLPTITTSGSANRRNAAGVDLTTGRPIPGEYTYSVGLAASLDLFTGFKRGATRRAASARTDAADAGFVNQRYQVTATTAQLFYTSLANEELVRVAETQLERAKEQLQIAVNKFQAGAATRSDTLTATVDLGNARLALLQAQANLATSQANLARQIGADQPVRAVPDTAFPSPPDTAALRADVIDRSPQVQQAVAEAKAAGSDVTAARAQYWPILRLSYNDTRQGPGSKSFPQYDETFTWRFGLSWTLFDGFSREASQASAAVQRDVARASAADTRRQLGAQLTQQLAALFTSYAQIGIAGANVVAATEARRVTQERYRLGAGTLLDLLTAEANLTQAEVNQVQARYDYLIARTQVEALVGHPL
jgi:outer membrane protein